MFTVDDIIDLGIQIEKNGEKILRDAQTKVQNPDLASLLQWLADEEAAHGRWFGYGRGDHISTADSVLLTSCRTAWQTKCEGGAFFGGFEIDFTAQVAFAYQLHAVGAEPPSLT